MLILLLLINTVWGSNILPVTRLETSDTIPKGVWTLYLSNSLANYEEEFNSQGNPSSFNNRFAREISYSDILDNITDPQERAITRAAFLNYGITDLSDIAGSTDGELAINTQINVPVLAYGATNRWSLGLALPIIKFKSDAKTGFNSSRSLQNMVNKVFHDGAHANALKIKEETDNAIQNELEKYDYSDLERNDTITGNLQFWQRYKLGKLGRNSFALGNRITFPKKNESDLNQLIRLDAEDEQWDASLSIHHSLPLSKFILTNTVEYTMQFEGKKTLRIPTTDEHPLSNLQESVNFNPGDLINLQHGIIYNARSNIKFFAAYQFQYKGTDSHRGNEYEQVNYGYLNDNTEQELQTALVGFNINTINWFLQRKFFLPMDLTLSVSYPIRGKNVIAAPLATLEVGIFYK